MEEPGLDFGDATEDDLHFDWEEVVRLAPKGYCEIQDAQRGLVYHGPVDKVVVDDGSDMVVITLKWAAQMGLPGRPGFGEWEKAPDKAKTIVFPNLMMPFTVEETPDKGKRLRFGDSLIYLDEVEGVDPKKVKGLDLPTG